MVFIVPERTQYFCLLEGECVDCLTSSETHRLGGQVTWRTSALHNVTSLRPLWLTDTSSECFSSSLFLCFGFGSVLDTEPTQNHMYNRKCDYFQLVFMFLLRQDHRTHGGAAGRSPARRTSPSFRRPSARHNTVSVVKGNYLENGWRPHLSLL